MSQKYILLECAIHFLNVLVHHAMEAKSQSEKRDFSSLKDGIFLFENLVFRKMDVNGLVFFQKIVCNPEVVKYSNVTPPKKTATVLSTEAEKRFFERALPSSTKSFPLCRFVINDIEKSEIGLLSLFKPGLEVISWGLYFTPENQLPVYADKVSLVILTLINHLKLNKLYSFENVKTAVVDYREDNLLLRSSVIKLGFKEAKETKEIIEFNGIDFELKRLTYEKNI